MPLSPAGPGAWTAAERTPDPHRLCAGDSTAVRFRVTFLAGAPAGTATFVAQAFTGGGAPLGSDSATRRVAGDRNAEPTPTKPAQTPPPTPTPSPSAVPTTPPTTEPAAPPTEEGPALAVPLGATDSGDGFGLGALVMILGLAMVAIGGALLVVLLRRTRGAAGGDGTDDGGGPGGGDPNPTLILPTVRG